MKWIDRISGRELTVWIGLACVLVAAARGAGDVPGLPVTGSGSFDDGSNDDLTWKSRARSIVLNRHEQLVTNWVTVETIDLGASVTNGLKLTRSVQVGKVTTNELVHLEFQGQTNIVTFKIGESGYVIQQTVTNEAPSITVSGGISLLPSAPWIRLESN